MPRFNVDFSDEATAVLEELARRYGTTKADVIRRAIAKYRWFYNTMQDGNKIVVEAPNGSLREVIAI